MGGFLPPISENVDEHVAISLNRAIHKVRIELDAGHQDIHHHSVARVPVHHPIAWSEDRESAARNRSYWLGLVTQKQRNNWEGKEKNN